MREVYTEEHQIEFLRQGVRDLKKAMMKYSLITLH